MPVSWSPRNTPRSPAIHGAPPDARDASLATASTAAAPTAGESPAAGLSPAGAATRGSAESTATARALGSSEKTARAKEGRAQQNADPGAAHLAWRLHEGLPASPSETQPHTQVALAGTGAPATRADTPMAKQVADTVARIAREEASEGPWTAPDGMCLDLAAKWQARLVEEGIPARIATVDPARRQGGEPVEKGMEGKFHAFAVVDVPGHDPLIIDGSWRQFIAGAEAKPEIPGIFVGTLDELKRALAPHQSALQVEIHDDPLLGRRDPGATVDLAYGAGRHAGLREVLGDP